MKSLPVLIPVLAFLAACRSAEEFAEEADRDVYALVDQRRAELFDEQPGFRIEPDADSLRRRILRGEAGEELTFDQVTTLSIAAENNREYQDRKEALYRAALDVTRERWELGWQPTLTGAAAIGGVGSSADTRSGALDFRLRRILGTGAEVIGGIGLSIFDVVGSGDSSTTTNLDLSIFQPLLRGSGSRIVYEPLTQAERDLVYQVRSFERFRRSFAVDVTVRLLDLLAQVDSIRNEELNVENLRLLRERNEALAEAGRTTDIEVDQARQNEVQSANRLVIARSDLQSAYDEFLLFLGLPIDTPVRVDLSELERLQEQGLDAIEFDEETVLDYAHDHRLDFMTSLDQVDDAARRVYVAADALRAGLDVAATGALASTPDAPLEFDLDDANWSLALALDLPIDRLPERNFYRSALIDLETARRDAEEFRDTITTNLRDQLRTTVTAKETFDLQLFSEELAERRVESAQLNLQAGRATTRDILEAQQDLLDSRNQVTQALVSYLTARLQLYRDMELIEVDLDEGLRLAKERLERAAEERSEPEPSARPEVDA